MCPHVRPFPLLCSSSKKVAELENVAKQSYHHISFRGDKIYIVDYLLKHSYGFSTPRKYPNSGYFLVIFSNIGNFYSYVFPLGFSLQFLHQILGMYYNPE